MAYRQAFNSGNPWTIASVPLALAQRQQQPRQRTEAGRKTLLQGWFIAILGIVAYCHAMLSSAPPGDAFTSLSWHGVEGWVAIVLIVVGTVRWFTGYLGLVNDVVPAGVAASDGPGE